MQEVSEAAKTITGAVMKWKGVSSQPHRCLVGVRPVGILFAVSRAGMQALQFII